MTLRTVFAGAVIAAGLAVSTCAQAGTLLGTYTVDSLTPYGSWQDTGLALTAGESYDFVVNNPSTIWSAGVPPNRTSTANGIDPIYYGEQTMAGFTANFGSLVGQAGSKLFLIGTGPTVLTGLSGDLTVGYWDSYYGDNSGTQSLSISAVPEPAAWVMLLLGFFGIGFMIRSSRHKDAVSVA